MSSVIIPDEQRFAPYWPQPGLAARDLVVKPYGYGYSQGGTACSYQYANIATQWNRVITLAYPTELASVESLRELKSLEAGWDSYNALPIGAGAITQAIQIVEACQLWGLEYPQVVPMANGGVALEWYSELAEVEVEILGELAIEFSMVKGDEEIEGRITPTRHINQEAEFRALISTLFAGVKAR